MKRIVTMLLAIAMIFSFMPKSTEYAFATTVGNDTSRASSQECCSYLNVDGIESHHNYANNENSYWNISCDGATYISITFDSKTELEQDYDYITIESDQYYETYTGTALAGKTIDVDGNDITINLTSDSSSTYYGFKVEAAKAVYEKHSYVNEYITDDDGQLVLEKVCKNCGNIFINGCDGSHDFEVIDYEPPTCTEDGYEIKECTVCGEYEDTIIQATGHDFEEVDRTAGTCIKAGTIEYECVNCGKIKTVKTSLGKHSYTKTVRAATYREKGKITYKCKYCGDSYYTTIPVKVINRPVVTLSTSATTSVLIRWGKNSSQVEGFKIYRSRNATSGYKLIKTVGRTASSFKDQTAIPGMKYYYKVRAYNGSNKSKFSTYKSITVKKLGAPSITVSNIAKGVKISYKKVGRATGYEIYYSKKASSGYKKLATTKDLRYSKNKGFIVGKKYYFKVRAYKTINGKKHFGPYSKVKKTIVTSLKAPTVKKTSEVTKTTIKISWKKVSGAKGYKIYRKRIGGSYKKIATVGSNKTSYTNKNVSGQYVYRVKAYKGTELSGASSEIYARTLGKTTIDVDQYSDEFKDEVTWKSVAGATAYQVYYKVENGSWHHAVTTSNLHYEKSVTHCKWYKWKVRAIYKENGCKSVGSFSKTDELQIYCLPNAESWISPYTDSDCGVIGIEVTNYGKHTMTVYSEDAFYSDNDYYSFDRDLYLIDEDTVDYVSSVKIPAGKTKWLWFAVDGTNTWYDSKGRVYFDFKYAGYKYRAKISSYYGSSYWEK